MTDKTAVSTTPSGTEICYALGIEPAAVSHACDFPPRARDRPELTSTCRAGASRNRYDIDINLLRKITPDVIITQSVCGTCAVDESRVSNEIANLPVKPEVLSLNAASLADVYDCITDVGKALGRSERASRVNGQLKDCVNQIDSMTNNARTAPNVVVLEWLDPLRAAGNWVPDLVTSAGGQYPLAKSGQRSTEISWSDLLAVDPDLLVLAPCSLDPASTLEEAERLQEHPKWDQLTAVKTGQVFTLEGSILSRWTPRLGGALEQLASLCHPSLVG